VLNQDTGVSSSSGRHEGIHEFGSLFEIGSRAGETEVEGIGSKGFIVGSHTGLSALVRCTNTSIQVLADEGCDLLKNNGESTFGVDTSSSGVKI
jgi:hypothetical protein